MNSRLLKFILGGIAVVSLTAAAQKAPNCVASLAALEQRVELQRQLLWDWAGLIHYGSANTELPKPKPEETRVIFLGDEITENWPAEKFFPGKPYFNRGIDDIASVHGPITQQMSAENITSMVELAKANNIKVVLASVTPICDCYTKRSLLRPFGKIIGLNNWLEEYAAASGSVYLNYYAALGQGRNQKKEFTADGVLLNDAAYAVMAPLAETAINQALGKK